MTTPNPILPVSPELSIPASILVVDDEEAVRNVLARGLWAAGFQCMTAADGTQALARLRQGRFAVMLLDIRMPGMDGLAVLAEAQRLDPDMPVIMVTALAGLDVALGAIRSGAYDYVTIPAIQLRSRQQLHPAPVGGPAPGPGLGAAAPPLSLSSSP